MSLRLSPLRRALTGTALAVLVGVALTACTSDPNTASPSPSGGPTAGASGPTAIPTDPNATPAATPPTQTDTEWGRIWDGLPDDLKEVFSKNSDEAWLKQVGEIWRAGDDAGIKIAVDAGNEHIVLTHEETEAFSTALAPVVDKWIAGSEAKGIDGKALVEAARAAIAKHSA